MTGALPPCAELRARSLLAAPGVAAELRDAAITIRDGRIATIGMGVGAAGSEDLVVLPAPVNAHDHGRGLRRHAYGAVDDALEPWLPASSALHPAVDPYLVAAAAFGAMALSGVGTVVHFHMPQRWDRLGDEAEAVCRAARDIGLRLAFLVPMADRNRLSYDGDDAVLARLDPADVAAVRARFLRPSPPPAEQVAAVEAVARRVEGPDVNVQFAPFGVEWASDALLELMAEASARTGRRVHMHAQETLLQRAWTDRAYPGGLFPWLDRIGLLSPRLALAHGVHIRRAEMDLLAARGAAMVINASSNLRLRSGIAPVPEYLAAGTPLAYGLDALALDDDMDMLRELRLVYRLHAGRSLRHDLDLAALWRGAAGEGARIALGRNDFGTLNPGAPADFVALDRAALAADLIDEGATSTADLVLARARREHVRHVVVNGRYVVRDGRLTGVDMDAITRELLAQARAGAPAARAGAPLVARLQAAVREHYLARPDA